MFEDFKQKIKEKCKETQKPEPLSFSPEVLEKTKQQDKDPETVTLA
jgi:hypothetical protein